MQLVRRPYDHADVIGLTEIVQAGYVELYGGPDETPVEPGEFAPPRGGFVVGYAGGPGAQTPIAMGGWRLRDDGRAELKRMFVHPDHRGQGLSREVLRWLETDAAAAGATALVLETGRPQVAAVELYRSAGYTDVEPFGYYAWSPTSVYLGRELGVVRTGQNGAVPQTDTALDPEIAALLKRDAAGLVAAVVQQHDTGEVLMVGWMNDDALSRTLTTGRVTFWSRSRNELWRKGDTSGHVQWVKSVALDCDGDALLVRVDQVGAACHTGDHTCFDARPLPAVVAADGDTKVATA